MWFWKGVIVSFPSSRVCSSPNGYEMLVGTEVCRVTVVSWKRPAAKNQIRSFQIGPPSVAS